MNKSQGHYFPKRPLTPHEFDDETRFNRYIADNSAFWMMCRQKNGACTRARCCRGNPDECVERFSDLMPDDAREWLDAIIMGPREGLSFAQLAEENVEEFEVFAAWRDAVEAAFGPLERKSVQVAAKKQA